MLAQNSTAAVVLDEDGDSRGWINERHLATAYLRWTAASGADEAAASEATANSLTAADIMEERVPECPAGIPLAAAVQIMIDLGVDHLFFLHHAGGRAWPASVLSWRDVLRTLAGPEYIQDQGAAAPRPTPMDLFRQRYGLPKKGAG